jgi:hypothetical protein
MKSMNGDRDEKMTYLKNHLTSRILMIDDNHNRSQHTKDSGRTIAMIYRLHNLSIGLSMGQLRIHHRRRVYPYNLSDIQSDHLKQLSRSLLNLVENIGGFDQHGNSPETI